jgi:prephenate dehydrogenase
MLVAIVGLGLIGGSLGLALRRSDVDIEVVGFARRQEVASRALEIGAVDRIEGSLPLAVKAADVVIVATPAMAVREVFIGIADHLRDGVVVTDTASTKSMVMGWAGEYFSPSVNFIGGHPMAGKELSGIDAADGGLFSGCTYCLMPGGNTDQQSVGTVEGLVRRIGAIPLFIDAEEHDTLVAGVSHLPLVLSLALVSVTTGSPLWPALSKLAASGYRDLTRLAAGDTHMGRDICVTNRDNIIDWIDEYIAEMKELRRRIEDGGVDLEEILVRLKGEREAWMRMKDG